MSVKVDHLVYSIDELSFIDVIPIASMFTEDYCRPIAAGQIGRMATDGGFNKKKAGVVTLSMWPDGR